MTVTLKRSISVKDVKNEHYTIVWLDQHANENKLDLVQTRTSLKQINNDKYKFFNDKQKFLTQIEIMNCQELKTLVIMSGQFSKDILYKTELPSVTDTTTLSSDICTPRKIHLAIDGKLPSVIIFCDDCINLALVHRYQSG